MSVFLDFSAGVFIGEYLLVLEAKGKGGTGMIVLGIYSRHAQGPGGRFPTVFCCKILGVSLRILSGIVEWRKSIGS